MGIFQSLAMKRVGVLHGGHPHILDIAKRIPPSQQLKIARYNELSSNYSSSTAWSEEEERGGGYPCQQALDMIAEGLVAEPLSAIPSLFPRF